MRIRNGQDCADALTNALDPTLHVTVHVFQIITESPPYGASTQPTAEPSNEADRRRGQGS